MEKLNHKFVEFIPKKIEDGTIYISIRFKTAVHTCACGCGNKTVTPISPADWKLIFNGQSITLKPSIGNWNFPCRSHYWITNNKIKWAEDWGEEKVAAKRNKDKAKQNRYRNLQDYNKSQKPRKKRWWLFRLLFGNNKK